MNNISKAKNYDGIKTETNMKIFNIKKNIGESKDYNRFVSYHHDELFDTYEYLQPKNRDFNSFCNFAYENSNEGKTRLISKRLANSHLYDDFMYDY